VPLPGPSPGQTRAPAADVGRSSWGEPGGWGAAISVWTWRPSQLTTTIGSVRSIFPKDHVLPRKRYVDPNRRRGRTSRRRTLPIDATPETPSRAAIPSAWSKTVRDRPKGRCPSLTLYGTKRRDFGASGGETGRNGGRTGWQVSSCHPLESRPFGTIPGVIERRRESLGGDVDDDPEDKVGSCRMVRSSPTQTDCLKTSVGRLVPPG
jgi:hypothetical protein